MKISDKPLSILMRGMSYKMGLQITALISVAQDMAMLGCDLNMCSWERFAPDRWTPENEATIPRYAYLPFGTGPHVCIGNHVALMEAQLVLTTLIQRVTFELVPGQTVELAPQITLRSSVCDGS